MNIEALKRSIDFIDSWLDFQYGQENYPGYSVAISYKGKIIFNKAYGYANLESKIKLTPEHVFRIASQSKTFTATALLQLQEKGKLKIDDYIKDYLPWLNQHTDKRWQKVTLRQLMSHSAGVIRDGLNSDYWNLERPFPKEEQFKDEILETKLVIDNNTRMKYSNYGYTLLGMVVESVSKQPYNEYVIKNIIEPLDLKNTGPEYTSKIDHQLVTGYTRLDFNKKRLPIAQLDTKAMSPATGFYSNGQDLCVYFNAHILGSKKLLNDESKKEMQRLQWPSQLFDEDNHRDYGLGFEIEFLNKKQIFGHNGGFPGFMTKTIVEPSNQLVISVMTNCIDGLPNLIVQGIDHIINYYQNNLIKTKSKYDFTHLEGRYMNLWSIMNIVANGEKLIATSLPSWQPFRGAEELKCEKENCFRIIQTGSFKADNELVKFIVKKGRVKSIKYSGATLLPEKVWLKQNKNKKIIG